jgi:hypothetical protein
MHRNVRVPGLRVVPLVFACTVFAIGNASAQTGTISGRATDAEGEAVPYAAVSIEGTTRGVLTNLEGRYVFANLRVGTYSIKIQSMGHAPVKKTGIEVDAGRTTVVDFRLTGKPIVITGTTVTGTRKAKVNTLSSVAGQAEEKDDFHSLPVLTTKEVIAMKAGVIDLGGKLHFRGGRESEILTIVDGVASRNPLNSEGVDLGLLSVESSEQVLGGMDAQY